jgi:DNA-binding protein HU-beta
LAAIALVKFKGLFPMTKAQLVSHIAEKTSSTKKVVDAVLKSLIETVQLTLKDGGQLRIDGLGTFRVIDRKARTGVNPRNGAKLEIPACKVPAFRAATALKQALQGEQGKPAAKPVEPAGKKSQKKK